MEPEEYYAIEYAVRIHSQRKSVGHVLFTEQHEYFVDDAGVLWKASRSAAFANGRRLGRWEAPAHLAAAFIEQMRPFEVSS